MCLISCLLVPVPCCNKDHESQTRMWEWLGDEVLAAQTQRSEFSSLDSKAGHTLGTHWIRNWTHTGHTLGMTLGTTLSAYRSHTKRNTGNDTAVLGVGTEIGGSWGLLATQ